MNVQNITNINNLFWGGLIKILHVLQHKQETFNSKAQQNGRDLKEVTWQEIKITTK